MFELVKKKDVLIRRFWKGTEWINERLARVGHTPYVDSEIERFEREVIAPMDKEFSK